MSLYPELCNLSFHRTKLKNLNRLKVGGTSSDIALMLCILYMGIMLSYNHIQQAEFKVCRALVKISFKKSGHPSMYISLVDHLLQ